MATKATKHITVDAGKQLKSERQDIMKKDPMPMGDAEHFKITKDKKVRKGQ